MDGYSYKEQMSYRISYTWAVAYECYQYSTSFLFTAVRFSRHVQTIKVMTKHH